MARFTLRNLKDLGTLLTWSPKTIGGIEEAHIHRVRELAAHAYARVPHYRKLFDRAGFRPGEIRTMEDVRRLPVSTRPDLQDLPAAEVVAAGLDPSDLPGRRTSGSTGRPLTVRKSGAERAIYNLQHWRTHRSFGTGGRERRTTIGLVHAPLPGTRVRSLYRKFGLFRMEHINVLAPTAEIVRALRETRPDIVICPSSQAAWIAGELTDEDRRYIRPRLVLTWGETVAPELRGRIGEGFRARTVDYYASHELRSIAVQCPESEYYHVFDESVMVEVFKDGRPAGCGEEGELVGTALWSWAMPFIRYQIGDVVEVGPAPCPCGAICHTIKGINGRVMDRIPLPEGGTVHPYTITGPLVQDLRWIRRFQFIQESTGGLLLKIVGDRELRQEDADEVERRVGELIPEGLALRVEIADEIPPSPTGKYYPYVSLERWRNWSKGKDPL